MLGTFVVGLGPFVLPILGGWALAAKRHDTAGKSQVVRAPWPLAAGWSPSAAAGAKGRGARATTTYATDILVSP